GIIEFCPRIHPTLYEVTDQYARNGAVGHAHSTVASCYIDMLIAWVQTNECQIIVGFQYLARPAILDFINLPEPLTRPLFQSAEVRVRIIVLPSLVVFATDDENLRFRSLHQTLSSNIVIRIESVPVQSLVDTAEWNACSNRVRSVGH